MSDTSAISNYCLSHGNPLPCQICTSSATIPVDTPAAPDVAEIVRSLRGIVADCDTGYGLAHRAADTITRLAADLARVEREREETVAEFKRFRLGQFRQMAVRAQQAETELARVTGERDAAMVDAKRLDAVNDRRIALTPEYEGPWTAELYDEDEQVQAIGEGKDVRTAIDAAIAAGARGK